ncbi:hypothetical protein HPC49_01255 [Pyxidicoccus fallax]|uniref:Uncharacterized protein n=1 Tax=Pyxidicoccus fallax TaxID=394095 RepID=A0A848LDS7_9BACT|nr:hypothetical protein [Pyxidicoccus fallax]NMO13588.1 hypothetical protein [Pyxidicoccus fallax]NPC76881.1 hypothetical protein [Pyxidicoccus fallax]
MGDADRLLAAHDDAEQGLPAQPVGAAVQPCPFARPVIDKAKKDWIRIVLRDDQGVPLKGERYRLRLPDGSVKEGDLDVDGGVWVQGFEPGACRVSFPDIERSARANEPPEESG